MEIHERARKDIRVMMNDVTDTLAAGGCNTWGDYQKLAGIIEGLARAERIILDLEAKAFGEEGDGT